MRIPQFDNRYRALTQAQETVETASRKAWQILDEDLTTLFLNIARVVSIGRRKHTMRSILRALILAPAMIAAAALTTNSAMAESTINVPFSFTAAGQTFPAGKYIVVHDLSHNFVTLMGKKARLGFNWILSPGDALPTDTKVKLEFEHQNQGYALESIQVGALTTHRLDNKPRGSEHKTVVNVPGQ